MPTKQPIANAVDEKRRFSVSFHDGANERTISGFVDGDVCVMNIEHDAGVARPLRVTVTLVDDGRCEGAVGSGLRRCILGW